MVGSKWYEYLNKSKLTPPDWVFGVVWPILYVLIGLSMYFNKPQKDDIKLITFFSLQMFFNLIWTTIFFKLQMPRLALFDLFLTLLFTILYFIESIDLSKYLLIPYILWLLLAFYLNAYIVYKN